MLVAVSGSNGFIGKELCAHLINSGHEIIPVRKRDLQLPIHDFKEMLRDADIFISLAGAPILKRWTQGYKRKLKSSRIGPVNKVITALRLLKDRPRLLISTSAIGIYDNIHEHTEDSSFYAGNFLTELVSDWESEVMKAGELVNLRIVIFRLAVVLGRKGGAFPSLLRPFKFGLGGKIGNGKQNFSFVHIDDVIRAVMFVIHNPGQQGVFNLVAPEVITNRVFAKKLGKVLHRPSFMTVPSFFLKLIYGEAAIILLGGPDVKPKRLIDAGFEFKYENIELALLSLV
jgi:uncharacterized protein (TIGR01777 family)